MLIWIFPTYQDQGCFAMIGYRPKMDKPLPVNLQSPECLRHSGTVQHELLHVLGLLHEQARPDRDDHVKIMWDNIDMREFLLCNLKTFKCRYGSITNPGVVTFNVNLLLKLIFLLTAQIQPTTGSLVMSLKVQTFCKSCTEILPLLF